MNADTLTLDEFTYIKYMLDISERIGLDWPAAVSLFPADTEEERHWKNRMLPGIELVHKDRAKGMPAA